MPSWARVGVPVLVALLLGGTAGFWLAAGRGASSEDSPLTERYERLAWTQEWPDDSEEPIEVFAAPDGTGVDCSAESPCSLADAQIAVRARNQEMVEDIVVQLADGTYFLDEPLVISGRDSGTGGRHVSWQAAPGATPVLSGGKPLDGWELDDAETGIYVTSVGEEFETRQLFVDGERAIRARGPLRPEGWARSDEGFTAPDDTMASWRRPSDLEIVSFKEWKAFRCPVDAVDGRELTMAQPCWNNANSHEGFTMTEVTWVENALELLDEPGEWYLDTETNQLYYWPLESQDMASVTVVASTDETLLQLLGTPEDPVHDVEFRGLTFAQSTWRQPSGPEGYAVTQAGWYLTGAPDTIDPLDIERTPGAVSVSYSRQVRFERNVFEQLGAVGLDLAAGSQDIGVVGNRFSDISGTAIQIGEAGPGAQNPPAVAQLDRLELSSNIIERAGAEYQDGVGILVTYASNVSILHNELADLPYSGIALGWGWGTDSYARNNVVSSNLIENVVLTLRDGGAIYTLSAMPETVIENNYIRNQANSSGALFLDDGTAFVTVADNVIEQVPRWLHIWTGSINNNVIVDNYTDSTEQVNEGTDNLVRDNSVGLTSWPTDAQTVIDGAGLTPDYDDIRPP